MTTLRIFIPNHWLETASTCAWVLFDGDTSIIGPATILREGHDMPNAMPIAEQVEVIIAAELVSFIRATLPAGNRKRVLESLPYLVEDSLMASPEQVHVVIAEMLASNEAMLATIDKRVLSALLENLSAAGITPQRLLPVTLLPTLPTFGWAMVYQNAECFLRTSYCSGIPLEMEDIATPPLALQLAINQAREKGITPDSLYIYSDRNIDLSSWQGRLGVPCVANAAVWRNSVGPAAMNFLQGAYAPLGMGWTRLAQAKPAAMLLAAILVIQLSGICIDWAVKSHQQSQLDQQMTSLFMATFPDTTVVVDAPLQMHRKYAEIQHSAGNTDASDFLPLLTSITTQLGKLPVDSVKSMDYESGKLVISLHAENTQTAQGLLEHAQANGLNASLNNLKPSGTGVDFELIFNANTMNTGVM
ncbi:MAG TPA: type II secretion system protein GspL [Methylophilaceae bacterium]|nr:type II secretion system protein GspL [Methylophilaceae bacterium]HSI29561.1 type II secretion system protein GspL [Methylophilus sp.]